MRLICDSRTAASRLPLGRRTPSPPDSPSREPAAPPIHYSHSSDRRGNASSAVRGYITAASSPNAPTRCEIPDEEHPIIYRGSSMSSKSSAFSTDSPYTPVIQSTPTSYTFPLELDSKTGPSTTHAHVLGLGGETNRSPVISSSVVQEVESSSGTCHQYVEYPTYLHEPPHQLQHTEVTFSQHSVVGPDGLLYTSQDAASIPVTQGDSHPYPHDTPYFYS